MYYDEHIKINYIKVNFQLSGKKGRLYIADHNKLQSILLLKNNIIYFRYYKNTSTKGIKH